MAHYRSSSVKPDATKHNPDPEYIRGLVEASGLSQQAAAREIGISARVMRYYLSGEREAPYPVQFCLQNLKQAKR
jgi:predicted transcriptional regulator